MTDQLAQLDPTKVLADDNTRYSLKPTRIQSLMDSILEQGGVIEPVEVEPLNPVVQGCTHRLTMGFYRHAALLKLNREQNAGLLLPAIVRPINEGVERVKRQLAENMERENQSPMDKAVAIKRLLDQGVGKPEIRRIFSSAGGRKGNTVQPMSNAMLNILVRLLDLPKGIQEKIHDGRVGVEAAYLLGKVAPEKRAAVLEKAEAARLAQIEQEEKDEQRYLDTEKKAAEAEQKAAAAQTEAEKAKADVVAAEALLKEKRDVLKTVKNGILAMDEPAGPKEVEASKAAEQDVKSAEKMVKDAKNRVAKALGTATTATELAAAKKAELEATRKAVKGAKKVKAVGKEDVKKAAAAEGVSVQGAVALSASDMRSTLKDFIAGKEGADDRVAMITRPFKDLFDGKDTPKETIRTLTAILDSMGASISKAAAPKPAEETAVPKPVAKVMPTAPAVQQGPVQKVKKQNQPIA